MLYLNGVASTLPNYDVDQIKYLIVDVQVTFPRSPKMSKVGLNVNRIAVMSSQALSQFMGSVTGPTRT